MIVQKILGVSVLVAIVGTSVLNLPKKVEAANLIQNPGFETASADNSAIPESWIRGRWGTNTAVFSYPVTSGDGSKAARVQITAHTSGDAKWASSEYDSIIAGHRYRFSDSYISDISTFITVEILLSSGSKTFIDIATPPASTSWTSGSWEFTAPSGAVSARVYHLINKVGVLTIDNVNLEEVFDGNLIMNPSLETLGTNGNPQYWAKGRWGTHDAVYTYPSAAQNGTTGAKVSISSYTTGDAKWYFNNVVVMPGANYEFSDYYRSSVVSYVTVQVKYGDGSFSYIDLGNAPIANNWTQFKRIFTAPVGAVSATVFHVLKNIGSLEVDNYSLSKTTALPSDKFDKGYVSLNFDDGYLSIYENALPILEAVNFKTDQFIITERLRPDFPGYMKAVHILDMQSKGHRIGAHTRTHPNLTTLSQQEAKDEIEGSRQDLWNIGATPVSVFAYPVGAYNNAIKNIVKHAGFIAARTSNSGQNTKKADIYALERFPMTNTTTFAQTKTAIDSAITNRTWLILLFHEVNHSGNDFAVTPELLQQIIDYLLQKNMPPITIEQGIDLIKK